MLILPLPERTLVTAIYSLYEIFTKLFDIFPKRDFLCNFKSFTLYNINIISTLKETRKCSYLYMLLYFKATITLNTF